MKNFKKKNISTAALTGVALSALVMPASAIIANAQDTGSVESPAPVVSPAAGTDNDKPVSNTPETDKQTDKDANDATTIEELIGTGTEQGGNTETTPKEDGEATPGKDGAATPEEKESNATIHYQRLVAKAGEKKMVSVIADTKTDLSGYTFAINAESIPEGWTVEIDAPTGIITATVAANATPGQYITVPVTATKEDADTLNGVVTIAAEGMKDINQPAFSKITLSPGVKATATQDNKDLPEGTTFAIAEDFPFADYEGYKFEVNPETGVLTVSVPDEAKSGTVTLPIVATYPDGTFETIEVEVVVKGAEKEEDKDKDNADTLAAKHAPVYADTEIRQGATLTIKQAGENTPEGTVFSFGQMTANYVGIVPTAINPETGDITVTADANVAVGTEIEVPVVATYTDGSKNTVIANVKAVAATPEKGLADTHTPGYKRTTIKAGEVLTVKQTGDLKLPEGTTFALDDSYASQGWRIDVGSSSGDLIVHAPEGVKAGTFVELPVIVTYSDGTSDRATLAVTVVADEKADAKPEEKPADKKDDKKGADAPIINVESDTPDVDVKVEKERKRGFLDYFTRWFESPTAGKVVDGVSENVAAYQLSQAAKHNTPLPANGADGKAGPAVHTGGQVER